MIKWTDFLKNPKNKSRNSIKRSVLLIAGVFVPLTVYPLTLSDYINTSTVESSNSQFEANTTNNESSIQIIPNAEIIVVKQVINDDGGDATLSDFSVATSAGPLTFDAGVAVGTTTTYTSETLYVPPGTYSLTEVDFAGYSEGSWSCTVGTLDNDAFDAGSISLAFGQQTTCTIINDDIAPNYRCNCRD